MINDIELFHFEDFADYGRDAALVITNELNSLLLDSIDDNSIPGRVTITELKNDMRAAPQLYLSDATIKKLGLIRFSNHIDSQ